MQNLQTKIYSKFKNDCLIEKWKNYIKNSITELYHDIGDSGFIVGSFQNKDLLVEVKDIDVVILFEKLDRVKLYEAKRRAVILCEELNILYNPINFIPEFRQGPIKPDIKNNCKQIHFFFFEFSIIKRIEGHPFLCNWLLNNSKLFGEELSRYVNESSISKNALIINLNDTITSINRERIWYWEFCQKENEQKLTMKKKWQDVNSGNQYFELINYSRHVIHSFLVYTNENKVNKSHPLIFESKRILGLKIYNDTIVNKKKETLRIYKDVDQIIGLLEKVVDYL